jgi:hypothetical protein
MICKGETALGAVGDADGAEQAANANRAKTSTIDLIRYFLMGIVADWTRPAPVGTAADHADALMKDSTIGPHLPASSQHGS